MIRGLLGRKSLLSQRQQELRARERELLDRLEAVLTRAETDAAVQDLRHLTAAREQLDQLFLIVVAGEFNSGKSSFINALLGERLLPEGVTPTTDRINLLRWGAEIGESAREEFLLERTHPAELLRELNVVDTPGTNAVIRRHEELTRDFVPRADLLLFITSADRPFTESERAFLEQVAEWGKKIVVVVNKIDLLAREEERREVVDYVTRHTGELLGHEPEVFAVSARAAAQALEADDDAAWSASGLEAVEGYLLETLDQEERIRLKLLNPLNVGLRVAGRYREVLFQRLRTLADDVEAIEAIDQRLAEFHQEMLADLEPRLNGIDTLLLELEKRGHAFFEETIRIGRIRALMDSEAVRRDFESSVMAQTPRRIEEEASRVVDWLVERHLRVWQDIQREVEQRRRQRPDEDLIQELGSFQYNRQALLGSIGGAAKDAVRVYDAETESRQVANEVQGTFATTALAEVGAVGLGTLVATVITGAAADVTGILLATSLAVGGFYLIPRKRRQARRRFSERIGELRTKLHRALERQAHEEIRRSTERLNEAIAPYRRFVETQRAALNEARGELVAVADALERLREEIGGRR